MKRPDGYGRLAPIYDTLASAGTLGNVFASQTVFLESLAKESVRILILGAGTGRILGTLKGIESLEQVVILEKSSGMQSQIRKKLLTFSPEFQGKVQILASSDKIEGIFDLVCAPFFLDQFSDTELKEWGQKIDSWLSAGGAFYFSDFVEGGNKFPGKYYLSALYRFFWLLCGISATQIPDYTVVWKQKQWEILNEQYFFGKMIRAVVFKKSN